MINQNVSQNSSNRGNKAYNENKDETNNISNIHYVTTRKDLEGPYLIFTPDGTIHPVNFIKNLEMMRNELMYQNGKNVFCNVLFKKFGFRLG